MWPITVLDVKKLYLSNQLASPFLSSKKGGSGSVGLPHKPNLSLSLLLNNRGFTRPAPITNSGYVFNSEIHVW